MRTILPLSIALLVFLSPSIAAQANTWNTVATAVFKSIAYLENEQGSCTAFVINDKAKDKDDDVDYLLTAAHCEGKDIYVDQQPATIISKDTKKDLMVLKVKNLDRPALKLAKDDPKIGDEVASYGYGYGLDRPLFRVTHISDDKSYLPFEGIGGPFFAVDTSFVPGQSGGPVVNAAGELVMVVQRGTEVVVWGVGADTINDKVGRFFGAK